MLQPDNFTERPEDQEGPPKQDFIFRWFLMGVMLGGICGFGVLRWIQLSGDRVKYPSAYVAFWALVAGIVCMFAAIFHRWLTR